MIMSLLGLGVFILVLLTFRLTAGDDRSTKHERVIVTLGEDNPSLQSPPPSIEIISTPSVPVEIKSGIPGDTTPNSNPVLSTSAVISTSCLGQILITEVMVHPNGVEPDDEWLELYNAGDCVVDLSSYKVGDEETSGQGEGMLVFPAGAKFNPGQVLVIANQAVAFSTSYGFLPDYEMKDTHPEVPNLERYTEWSSGSFNLANSGDEVILLNATDQVVDVVSWGSSSFAFNPSLKSPCPNCSFERIGYDFNVPATAALWVEQHTPNPGRVDFNSDRGTTTQAPVKTVTLIPVTPSPTRTVRSLFSSTPTHAPTPFTGRLYISEVLYDSVGPEPEEEWFEIYNPGSSAIDLSSFKIGDEETSGGNEGMYKFPEGARIVSGGVIVIAVQASSFQAGYGLDPDFEVVDSDAAIPNLEKYTRWASGTIYLSNTGDEVLLLDGTDSLVDVVSWGSSIFAFSPSVKLAGSGHSLERFPANMDTNMAGDWREQASPGPGSVDLSTPVSTPSMTNTISPSTQPSPVRSMTPFPARTATPTPTNTPKPSNTPTPTATRTATSTPTNTPTPSNTPTPTATWTATVAPSPSLNPTGRLVISEVLYRPAAIGDEGVFEPADEWIEIYNLESYPVDLSVYKIGDAALDDTGEGMLMFPAGACIAAEQVVVVANQADRFYRRYGFTPNFEILNTDPLVPDMVKYTTWPSGSVNLANTGDEVLLLDAGDAEVDIVSWGSSSYAFTPPVSSVEAGHSIERYPVNVDTDTAIDWRDQPNPSPGNIDCR